MEEATAALESNPADGCQATKDDLIADGLKSIEFCAICARPDVNCEVTNHLSQQAQVQAPPEHIRTGLTSYLVVQLNVSNVLSNEEINVPVLVDGRCEVTSLLLHPSDFNKIHVNKTGEIQVRLADQISKSMMNTYDPVRITLTFSDGSTVSAVVTSAAFDKSEESIEGTVIVGKCRRILGYDALKALGVKQDFKSHCLVRAIRRV